MLLSVVLVADVSAVFSGEDVVTLFSVVLTTSVFELLCEVVVVVELLSVLVSEDVTDKLSLAKILRIMLVRA